MINAFKSTLLGKKYNLSVKIKNRKYCNNIKQNRKGNGSSYRND